MNNSTSVNKSLLEKVIRKKHFKILYKDDFYMLSYLTNRETWQTMDKKYKTLQEAESQIVSRMYDSMATLLAKEISWTFEDI